MQQTSTKRVPVKTQLSGEGDPLGIVQETEIWPKSLMVYAQTRIQSGKWDAENFEIQTDHLIPARRLNLVNIKKRTVNFAVLANHSVKIKENEKRDEYLDLARELNKLWNIKVKVILIVIGALGTTPKGLVKELEELEIEGRAEAIQTTALLRLARILRRFMETRGDFLSLKR